MTVLVDWLQPWSDLYRSSAAAQALVLFGHLGGVALAGGFAVSADRTVVRVRGVRPAVRIALLGNLRRTHWFVMAGLAMASLSGIARLLADLGTFLPSWVFWLKMLLLAALLVNGRALEIEGLRLRDAMEAGPGAQPQDPAELPGWQRLRTKAVRSASLWAATVLVGVLLTTV